MPRPTLVDFSLRSPTVFIIDEFQRAPGLGLALKALIDADRRPGRFLITGSVNLSAKQKNSDSLAGRVVGAQVRGFQSRGAGGAP